MTHQCETESKRYVSLDLPEKFVKSCSFSNRIGFSCTTLHRKFPVEGIARIDNLHVINLSNMDRRLDLFKRFADRLPLMNINVVRFYFTAQAFIVCQQAARGGPTPSQQALEFYIETDYKYRKLNKVNEGIEFSNFLHLLGSGAYFDYIFDLAEKLNLVIDLSYTSKRDQFERYIKRQFPTKRPYKPAGYMNVIIDDSNGAEESKWYVNTNRVSVMTNDY